jgi:hypothetical protein
LASRFFDHAAWPQPRRLLSFRTFRRERCSVPAQSGRRRTLSRQSAGLASPTRGSSHPTRFACCPGYRLSKNVRAIARSVNAPCDHERAEKIALPLSSSPKCGSNIVGECTHRNQAALRRGSWGSSSKLTKSSIPRPLQ